MRRIKEAESEESNAKIVKDICRDSLHNNFIIYIFSIKFRLLWYTFRRETAVAVVCILSFPGSSAYLLVTSLKTKTQLLSQKLWLTRRHTHTHTLVCMYISLMKAFANAWRSRQLRSQATAGMHALKYTHTHMYKCREACVPNKSCCCFHVNTNFLSN